jgi:hypothetical protein
MKLFNDTKIYLWFSIVTFVVFAALAVVSFYSILVVEKKAISLRNSGFELYKASIAENVKEEDRKNLSQQYSDKFREEYILLRSPQVFGRYENFDRSDRSSDALRNVLSFFDTRVAGKAFIPAQDAMYINILLERRMMGSRLGRNTAFFFLFLSLAGFGFWQYEKRSLKKAQI